VKSSNFLALVITLHFVVSSGRAHLPKHGYLWQWMCEV